METLLNWAMDTGGLAVAFVVNTGILCYVLKSINKSIENNTQIIGELKEVIREWKKK